MAMIPYRTARAQAANYAEMGKRVAPAIKQENETSATPWQRAQVIVTRGTYGDPVEADPPLSMRQQRERDHDGPPVRPIGPRPWASNPTCSETPAQLDLAGQSVPLPTPPAPSTPAVRGQQLGLDVTVPRSYRSQAWGGTVTEPPLALETGPARSDAPLDDHNRPPDAPARPHLCPGPATCKERWLTDQELEALDAQEA